MPELSCKQKEIVELPLDPICVTACAGSGKTRTAVHRLWKMRRQLEDRHGIIALLSFSNVAVETFRKHYYALGKAEGAAHATGVEISTVDAFITSNILRPHAHRTMKAPRTAYLVHGREPFLGSFKVYDGQQSHSIAQLAVRLTNDRFGYSVAYGYGHRVIEASVAEKAIAKFGATGAYTHSLGRYWAILTLAEQKFVVRAIARRYPHILIDEAQDIGAEHQFILEALRAQGVRVSLIGDVNQGIYEFSGADGKFLAGFNANSGVISYGLTENFRSVPDIVEIANKLSGRADTADRARPPHLSGAFIVPYKAKDTDALLATFHALIASANFSPNQAAIICRSSELVGELRGPAEGQGQGTVRAFAEACLERDKHADLQMAFEHVCHGVVALLASNHSDLLSLMSLGGTAPKIRRAKHLIWTFMRDSAKGLPSSALAADGEWHKSLVERVKLLLTDLEAECALKPGENLGKKLAKKKLTGAPLHQAVATGGLPKYRIATVHKVKGESIPAVLYVATKANVRDLLDGTSAEEGRIGYVALTRACDLFMLAVPEDDLIAFEGHLLTKGFCKLPDGLGIKDPRSLSAAEKLAS